MALHRSGPTALRAAAVLVLIAATPLLAHHSFASTYSEDQRITVQGTVVTFLYRNPHSFITLDAADPKTHELVRWDVEWASTTRLGRAGIGPDSLKPGDHVIVLGHPGRRPEEHRLHMWGIVRPSDGWKWGHAID
jgi:Family of unknown function (DUF6152)